MLNYVIWAIEVEQVKNLIGGRISNFLKKEKKRKKKCANISDKTPPSVTLHTIFFETMFFI